jgi:toxin FitB
MANSAPNWIAHTDVLIEGERANPAFLPWIEGTEGIATADIVRAEFLYGIHFVPSERSRQSGLRFYEDRIAGLKSVSHEPKDFEVAARLSAEARRRGRGHPSLIDGLIAATAIRLGATVATRNLKDFEAMGVECADPFAAES